jgi:hypothetical protein
MIGLFRARRWISVSMTVGLDIHEVRAIGRSEHKHREPYTMSAFIVSHDHVDTLLSFATERDTYGNVAFDYGPRCRIYYWQRGEAALVLRGGDKSSQQRDLCEARKLMELYR